MASRSSAVALFEHRRKDMIAAQTELRAAAQSDLSNAANIGTLASACTRMGTAIREYQNAAKAVPRADSSW